MGYNFVHMKNKQKGSIGIVITIFIALMVIGGGAYFYTTKKVPIIDTTNWNTFRDEKYGFEFKYPLSLGRVIEQPLEDQQKLDCSPSSGYDQVTAAKSIEGLDVQISCNYNFEKTAATYAKDYRSGEGAYEVIENNGKKSYLFNYVSGVGYANQELYIPFLNGTYILLGQSYKTGEEADYPQLTNEQIKGIVSTFNVLR